MRIAVKNGYNKSWTVFLRMIFQLLVEKPCPPGGESCKMTAVQKNGFHFNIFPTMLEAIGKESDNTLLYMTECVLFFISNV